MEGAWLLSKVGMREVVSEKVFPRSEHSQAFDCFCSQPCAQSRSAHSGRQPSPASPVQCVHHPSPTRRGASSHKVVAYQSGVFYLLSGLSNKMVMSTPLPLYPYPPYPLPSEGHVVTIIFFFFHVAKYT